MTKQERLHEIFGRFVGHEAEITTVLTETTVDGEKRQIVSDVHTPKTNRLLDDIRATAAQHGLTTRFRWPGRMVTMDVVDNRVDFHMLRDARGKILVSLESGVVPPRAPDHADVAWHGLLTALKPLKTPRFKVPTA